MPYDWVEPELFVEHGGVKVFHIYKNDFVHDGRRECWFTTDICGGESDDPCAFDVRDLSTFAPGKPYSQAVCDAIDKGELEQEDPLPVCCPEKQFVHVILYNDPQECFIGMDIFDTFALAVAQFKARLQETREDYEDDPDCIEILTEDMENHELQFRVRGGYEVLYLREEVQHALGGKNDMRIQANRDHPGWRLSRECIRDTLLAKRGAPKCPWHKNRVLEMQTFKRGAPEIVITVRGGLVQEVCSTNPYTTVYIADYDLDRDVPGQAEVVERAAMPDMHIVY